MPTEEYEEDRGDPNQWVELTGEESRCLLGLKNYYKIFLEDTDEVATVKAWADLKKEFKHLVDIKWFK